MSVTEPGQDGQDELDPESGIKKNTPAFELWVYCGLGVIAGLILAFIVWALFGSSNSANHLAREKLKGAQVEHIVDMEHRRFQLERKSLVAKLSAQALEHNKTILNLCIELRSVHSGLRKAIFDDQLELRKTELLASLTETMPTEVVQGEGDAQGGEEMVVGSSEPQTLKLPNVCEKAFDGGLDKFIETLARKKEEEIQAEAQKKASQGAGS